jgi:hypothetical protein
MSECTESDSEVEDKLEHYYTKTICYNTIEMSGCKGTWKGSGRYLAGTWNIASIFIPEDGGSTFHQIVGI